MFKGQMGMMRKRVAVIAIAMAIIAIMRVSQGISKIRF